jgi:glycine/serine hydroxymethyltransferase
MENNPCYFGKDSDFSFISHDLSLLVRNRAMKLFRAPSGWHCNVQSLSDKYALFQLLTIHSSERITYYDDSILKTHFGGLFNMVCYDFNRLLSIPWLENHILSEKPGVLVIKVDRYPRLIQFKDIYDLCSKNNVKVILDISMIAPLLISDLIKVNPFECSDFIISNVALMRGIQGEGAFVFFKSEMKDIVQETVFPGSQGTHHINTMTTLGSVFLLCQTDVFRQYQLQVIKNTQQIINGLRSHQIPMIGDGSDYSWVWIQKENSDTIRDRLEKEGILVESHRNSGILLGTNTMTTVGYMEHDFDKVMAKITSLF